MLEDFNVLSVLLKGVSSLLKTHMNFINIKIIAGLHKK